MRNYEMLCIFQSDLEDSALKEAIDQVKGWITEAGGKVDNEDEWGKRKLAYLIRKQSEGHYLLLNISLPAEAIQELDRKIRFLEPVMRHLLTTVP
ncbi:MAG: 30S ribosomal protein S6 [Anaerolineae bacterium]|nr:30S ribosomal protein S6 [Anaerolineae bacterium]